jgi:hypothetical protein
VTPDGAGSGPLPAQAKQDNAGPARPATEVLEKRSAEAMNGARVRLSDDRRPTTDDCN